jgi:hypothetical protein
MELGAFGSLGIFARHDPELLERKIRPIGSAPV